MKFLDKSVIITGSRKNQIISTVFFGVVSTTSVIFDYFFIFPEVSIFNESIKEIRSNSYSLKIFADLSFLLLFISFVVGLIRNDKKSQPLETILIYLSLFILLFFLFFSTPLLFLWAHLHGYHLDHYEAAHRGGYYIFKLNNG